MAILELKLVQLYAQQECINVFTYVSNGTPATVSHSFALTSAFGAIFDAGAVPPDYPPGTLLQAIRAIQDADVTYQFVSTRNLYSVTDFYETPFNPGLAGGVSGEGGSPAYAIGYRSGRVRSDIRRGMKRFVGVPETFVGNLGTIANTTEVNALATFLGTNLTYIDEGQTLTYTPVVLGRQRYNPETGNADPNGTAYRYYPTETEQLAKVADGLVWDAYTSVRTQRSRQFGVGR